MIVPTAFGLKIFFAYLDVVVEVLVFHRGVFLVAALVGLRVGVVLVLIWRARPLRLVDRLVGVVDDGVRRPERLVAARGRLETKQMCGRFMFICFNFELGNEIKQKRSKN